ncbi:hypothetical protein [Sphingorhabdus sp. YGSMI21]|uniref:hypothetical protein n=1 Tax=Sphingorhabdus sp. YGSMI21 TaxID=2077182 RepID=UPI000C1EF6C5|nr:hypothetical protein [Sphingorhabdus sp. YGSMI21]ATW02716.1 hypothetical protein CHN51_03635 [Sphingorhabdus sp. YGSMI21]
MSIVDTNFMSHLESFQSQLKVDKFDNAEDAEAYVRLKKFSAFLADCHLDLRKAVENIDSPVTPLGYLHLTSKTEFGLMVHWLNKWETSPPAWFSEWLAKSELHRMAFDILRYLTRDLAAIEMSEQEYQQLMAQAKSPGLVGDDGTIFGLARYEQLDPKWMVATLNYVLNLVHPADIYHPFPNPELRPIALSPKARGPEKPDNPEPVLGIIGDWGGGNYAETGRNNASVASPAMRVIEDVKKQPTDYLIHLGDTYYAGTAESRLGPDSAHEELDNLVSLWPDQGQGRNFTLNSNHEMYGAGKGIFGTALTQSEYFAAQNGASVFALEYPIRPTDGKEGQSWLVLGLDSAYYSDTRNGIKMYMEGAIGTDGFLFIDRHRKQIEMIENVCAGHQGPIMVMTHHNPCDTITAETNILYDQVCKAIGSPPSLWYWGHVHNGIVYDRMIVGKDTTSVTKSRCCGHGAVPFGPAWGLENAAVKDNIDYYAHCHDPAFSDDVPRMKNGYALVTLHDDGGFTESFYEVGDTENPAYSRRWTAAEIGLA